MRVISGNDDRNDDHSYQMIYGEFLISETDGSAGFSR